MISEIVKKRKRLLKSELKRYKMIELKGTSAVFSKSRYIGDEILSGYYFEYLSLGLWHWRKTNRSKFHKHLIEDEGLFESIFDFPRIKMFELSKGEDEVLVDCLAERHQPIIDLGKMRGKEAPDYIVYMFLINLAAVSSYNYFLFSLMEECGCEKDYKSLYFAIEDKIFDNFYSTRLKAFQYGEICSNDKKKEFIDLLKGEHLYRPCLNKLLLSNYIKNNSDKEMFLFFIKYWASQGKILKFLLSTKNQFYTYNEKDDFWDMLCLLYKRIDNLDLEGPGLSLWWRFSKTLEFVISTFIFKIFVNWDKIFAKIYEKPGRRISRRLCDYVYKKLSKLLDGEKFDGLLPLSQAWVWRF